ncbi:MAG: helix-turn-helix transcriptional regulator [Clostridia bacterium]|nr:helix-turn-helix transcriptional regulator [Clostridia bacterium]
MDQIKTGRFIAEQRKAHGMTQRQLAEKLSVSDKTVSKWECGNGLPEVSLMLPLCELLSINVNELLSGERLDADSYKQHAEENMMKLIDERKENKRKLILEVVVVMITLLASCTLIMLSGLLEMETWLRVTLIAIGLVVMFGGIGVAAVLEMTAGYFECSKCGEHFVPTKTAYIMGAHTIMRRHLKCPHCGKRNWCRRRLAPKDEEKENA